MIILSKEKVKRHFFCNTLYLAHRRLGRGHLVLRHSVPHFPLNSAHFLCWGAKLKAAVLTRHQSEKSSSSIDRLIDHSAIFNTLGKSQKICKFKSFICKNILKTYKAITLRSSLSLLRLQHGLAFTEHSGHELVIDCYATQMFLYLIQLPTDRDVLNLDSYY